MPRSETPTEKAEKLKQVGNDAYRKGQFAAAIESYSKAVKVAPEEPVYLSNLSAAQVSITVNKNELAKVH